MTTKQKTTTSGADTVTLHRNTVAMALEWAVKELDWHDLHELTVESVRTALGGEETALALTELGAVEIAHLTTLAREEDSEEERRIVAAWNRLRPKHKVAAAYLDFVSRRLAKKTEDRADDPAPLLVAIAQTYGRYSAECFVDELITRARNKVRKKAAA